ncbi:GNAT family N-acetyltransferase [Kocuria marina]|uniref:GNAT family N-acetyltransferase n=1 Tax=Kocuria marina TaxID=223184 RepID=UPI002989EBBF|nr:GNAT family protein [Kocuria marina]MCT1722762.1 GNAT family N-acetyltransferase [Kocuria marina]MCT1734658.1 GNAT family N-acetyltransferase [Kocuria marina]
MTEAVRGRGWTTRAAATVAEWALDRAGLERLELGHRVNNPASGAVARAAGFRKEGTQRGKFLIAGERVDVDTYGRLRTHPRWQSSAAAARLRSGDRRRYRTATA